MKNINFKTVLVSSILSVLIIGCGGSSNNNSSENDAALKAIKAEKTALKQAVSSGQEIDYNLLVKQSSNQLAISGNIKNSVNKLEFISITEFTSNSGTTINTLNTYQLIEPLSNQDLQELKDLVNKLRTNNINELGISGKIKKSASGFGREISVTTASKNGIIIPISSLNGLDSYKDLTSNFLD